MSYFTPPGLNTPSNILVLLRRTFQIYITNIVTILLIAFTTVPPAQALLYLSSKYIAEHPQDNNENLSLLLVFFLIIGFVGIYLHSVTAAATIQATVNAHAEKVVSFRDIIYSVKSQICTLFGVSLIVSFLSSLGLLLLIIPGIYIYLCYSISFTVLIVEGKDVCGCMSRSWELSKGNRWFLFKSFFFFYLAFIITLVGINSVLVAIMANRLVSYMVGVMLPFLSFTPLLYILQTVIYFDVRARTEAYDREQLLEDMQKKSTNASSSNGNDVAKYDTSVSPNTIAVDCPNEDEGTFVDDLVIATDDKHRSWENAVSGNSRSAEQKYADFC